MHSNGKIILTFVGTLDDQEQRVSQQDEQEDIPTSLTKGEFEATTIESNYRELALNNW